MPLHNPPARQVPSSFAPAGAIAQTIPPFYCSSSAIAVVSGVLQLYAITLAANVPVSSITFTLGGTNGTTLTHGWYALLNSSLLQVAHTADRTSGNMAGASADDTQALVTPYTPAVTAGYYAGIMIAASVQPTLCGNTNSMGSSMFAAHPGAGPSTTGLTTPGTDGSTSYIAISATANPAYAYVS